MGNADYLLSVMDDLGVHPLLALVNVRTMIDGRTGRVSALSAPPQSTTTTTPPAATATATAAGDHAADPSAPAAQTAHIPTPSAASATPIPPNT